VKVKKPIKLCASDYIRHLMDWVDSIIEDEDIFSPSVEHPFPPNFQDIVKKIFRKLFRGRYMEMSSIFCSNK
jgi:MOB kinase activator 1